MKKLFNHIICIFIGHKHTTKDQCFDGQYHVCPRCGLHEYYDQNWYDRSIANIIKYRWYIYSKRISCKCNNCGKLEYFMLIHVNNHSNCLPF